MNLPHFFQSIEEI